ncbi:hypothetical protein GCM10009678_56170 [Actinomadura kijaniata]
MPGGPRTPGPGNPRVDAGIRNDLALALRPRRGRSPVALGSLATMVFASARFDLQPYVGFDMARYVRRTYCSWEDSGWRSLLVQRFEHVPVAEDMELPDPP